MLLSVPRIRSLTIALLSFGRAALAQSGAPEGAFRGRVLDDAGKPVPHARVVARDVGTGRERAAAVDAVGGYPLRALPA